MPKTCFLITSLICALLFAAGDPPELSLVVLGVAQDAGYPQAACAKACCKPAWADPQKRSGATCLAVVNHSTGSRFMFEATPHFTDQLRALDQLHPAKNKPILDGIFLTHGHIGHYTGLMQLGREVMGTKGVPVYAMPRMFTYLSHNGPWSQLVGLGNIKLQAMSADQPVRPEAGFEVTPLLVPHRDEFTEAVGYRIQGPNKAVLFIPDIDKWALWARGIETVIRTVDVAYLDGTFYDQAEMPGRNMSDIPHPFISESLARFASLPETERSKIRFIHFNHSNPVLDTNSAAAAEVRKAGFAIAQVGEIIKL